MLPEFEKACDDLTSRKCRKRGRPDKDDLDEDGLNSPKLKQAEIDTPMPLTQQVLDGYILDYITDSVLALHHVDAPAFVKLISRLTGGRLLPRCRQTVAKQLEERFEVRKQELKEKLANVAWVCTTADCWTSRRRSFLGVIVHWLEKDTLQRKGGCLALRVLSGRYTYDKLAKVLESINNEFNIGEKICFTVTDSGANFTKAFRHFSLDESEELVLPADGEDDITENTEEEDDMAFVEIDQELNRPNAEDATDDDNEEAVYKLPPHRKCACHLLNLIATKDAGKIEGITKRTSVQTFAKLTGLWNKQNRSPLVAETTKNAIGCLLVTPNDTLEFHIRFCC